MRRIALTLTATLYTLPALAQDTPLAIDLQNNLPYFTEADVAGGKLWAETVQADGYEAMQLMFNGEPVQGMTDVYVHIQAVLPIPETVGEDMVFVTIAGGGNGCPTLWAIVATSARGARATAPFGTCSEAILNPRLNEGAQVAFDMSPIGDDDIWMTYSFDGHDLHQMELSGPP